jgi:hypothetical protein
MWHCVPEIQALLAEATHLQATYDTKDFHEIETNDNYNSRWAPLTKDCRTKSFRPYL